MSLFLRQMTSLVMADDNRVEPESVFLEYLRTPSVVQQSIKLKFHMILKTYCPEIEREIRSMKPGKHNYIRYNIESRSDAIETLLVREDLMNIISSIDSGTTLPLMVNKLSKLKGLSKPLKQAINDMSEELRDRQDTVLEILLTNRPNPMSLEDESFKGQTISQEKEKALKDYTLLFEAVPASAITKKPTPQQAAKIDTAIKIAHRKLSNTIAFAGNAKTGKTTMALIAAKTLAERVGGKIYRLKTAYASSKEITSLIFSSEQQVQKIWGQVLDSLKAHSGPHKPIIVLDNLDATMNQNFSNTINERQFQTLFSSTLGQLILKDLPSAAHIFATTTPNNESADLKQEDKFASARAMVMNAQSSIGLSKSLTLVSVEPNNTTELQLFIDSMLKERELVNGAGLTFERGVSKTIANITRPNGAAAPALAFKIIDQALGVAAANGSSVVTNRDAVEAAAIITGASLQSLEMIGLAHTRSVKELGAHLRSRIFGQDHAILTFENKLKVALCGLNDETKPLGSFLFVGPTGVGKTELCREAAKYLGMNLIRIDMSEYTEPHALSKLIGSGPGYRDGEKGGVLSNALLEKPNSIVLLDEIEKAHPMIHNMFLQVMDNGEFRDGMGHLVNCRNAIVVFTSNAGAANAATMKDLAGRIGFDTPDEDAGGEFSTGMHTAITDGVARTFAPEFRNRLDAIVQFSPMLESTATSVSAKLLADLAEKMKARHKIELTYDSTVVTKIATLGFDIEYGARNIIRKIDSIVKIAIADYYAEASSKDQTITGIHLYLTNGDEVAAKNGGLSKTDQEDQTQDEGQISTIKTASF